MSTSRWASDDLDRIGGAEELQLASRRVDGTLRGFVTMWVVRAGDELYVRSAGGPDRPWYVRAIASRTGRVRAGGVERDATFEDASADAHEAIDAAYHVKYDRYGSRSWAAWSAPRPPRHDPPGPHCGPAVTTAMNTMPLTNRRTR